MWDTGREKWIAGFIIGFVAGVLVIEIIAAILTRAL